MGNQSFSKLSTAIASTSAFMRLVTTKRLHSPRKRVGKCYKLNSNTFLVFRETECHDVSGKPIVLVVGFRLRIIRSSRFLHWLFQRLCILTTPFWSGLKGFRIKLWMVDPTTKDYLGIYDWRGDNEAQHYINYLIPILHFFSANKTVWYIEYDGLDLEKYLKRHQVEFEFE